MYEGIFKRRRILTSVKEVNALIKNIKYYCANIIKIGRLAKFKTLNEYLSQNKWKSLNFSAIIEQKDTKLELTTMYGPEWLKPCTYIFNLNEINEFNITGHQAFAEFSKYFKVPKVEEYGFEKINKWFDENTGKYVCSAKPILGFNPKYEKKLISDCYEYDINSAYFNTLIKNIPDLFNPNFNNDMIKVKNNQVGFLIDDDLTLVKSGFYADIVFNVIPTPKGLMDYCTKYYNKKLFFKNEVEKLTAKAYLNLPIGYCQRVNPFLRAYVVHSCNNLIKNLINDDTLIWNTDAVISNKKIENIPIGINIGQFKEIKHQSLKYIGNTYQFNDNIPVYRGIPKEWFNAFEKINGRKFNLLQDSCPKNLNKWVWDWEKLNLRRNDYGEAFN